MRGARADAQGAEIKIVFASMSDAQAIKLVAAAAAAAGLGLGYLLASLTGKKKAPPSWGWGWFTDRLKPFSFSASDGPKSILVLDGKLPVKSKGPLLWLHQAPEELVGAPSASAEAISVPVGENAYAVDLRASEAQLAMLLREHGDFKWASPRDTLGLPAAGRATQTEIEGAVRAVSLLAWHRAHAYSGVDGVQTRPPPAGSDGRRRKLPSGRSLYPRVDPVAICLCISADGERCLLGRQATFPKGMYTCISGFVEHGESVERAAAREVLEETKVKVAAANLVASQPWPCGRGNSCELMLAVAARAERSGEAIDTGTKEGGEAGSGELEAARWFDRAQAKRMLDRANGKLSDRGEWVPPALAIAHHLVARWVEGTLAVP